MAVDISKGEHYATAYSLKSWELYTKFMRTHKLRLTGKDVGYSHGTKKMLGAIFTYFMLLVIKDIIENLVTFKLPIPNCWIEMIPISGEDFKRARLNGAFDDVDFLMSNFTGYLIYLRINSRYGHWVKQIHVTKKYKDRITELTNKGVGW